ncbi:hypothetical protein B0F90DRAFT_1690754 [Multifurca ochricompacta]|uniref:Uncharacterized protein n=1 Tax=Multifurca ochricompacta TaxID=376703 RepID=A0AAD4MAG3_9AGAM|nr:hypothetical protein B0F90DRAFT_1690754 [Multifurca ochricompacta]
MSSYRPVSRAQGCLLAAARMMMIWMTMMHYFFLTILHITFSVVQLTISFFLAVISALLSVFQDISSIFFELASDSSGLPPRSSLPTEKCAILILGAQEGVGRNAALRFSELGYTVFALCPNRRGDLGHQRPRDVASLLYIWHNRKERSQSIPWGLIAPMQLNVWSRSQRETVHETVRAYCNAYDLHLVALIISHNSTPLPGARPPFINTPDATDDADVPNESHVGEDAWRNSVLDEVTEPVLMAHDYKNLLAEASGRLIILSNFTDYSPLALLSRASRTAAAENLAEILEFQGIRVSSIYFGPLAEHLGDESPESHRNVSRRFSQSIDVQGAVDTLIQKISRQLIVEESFLITILRRVVQSRHPKFVYTVGLYPILYLAWQSAPISSRIAVKGLMRRVKSPGLAVYD